MPALAPSLAEVVLDLAASLLQPHSLVLFMSCFHSMDDFYDLESREAPLFIIFLYLIITRHKNLLSHIEHYKGFKIYITLKMTFSFLKFFFLQIQERGQSRTNLSWMAEDSSLGNIAE